MGWGAIDGEPDIAEVEGRAERFPRWARRAAVVAAVVLLLIGVFVVRRIEGAVEIAADEPRYAQRHLTETDVTVENPGNDRAYVLVEAPTHDGLRLREVVSTGGLYQRDPPEYVIPPRDEITLTLRWQPTDCARAVAGSGGPADLTIRVGPLIGDKEAFDVRLGGWGELVPPACDDFPDRGVPRLADQAVIANEAGLVAVRLAVDNAGGQPLRLSDVELPEGIDPDLIVDTRPHLAAIDIGSSLGITVRFRQNDCRAPVDGAARLLLRFHTPTTGRTETLDVPLADSWPNLLGSCVPPAD